MILTTRLRASSSLSVVNPYLKVGGKPVERGAPAARTHISRGATGREKGGVRLKAPHHGKLESVFKL